MIGANKALIEFNGARSGSEKTRQRRREGLDKLGRMVTRLAQEHARGRHSTNVDLGENGALTHALQLIEHGWSSVRLCLERGN